MWRTLHGNCRTEGWCVAPVCGGGIHCHSRAMIVATPQGVQPRRRRRHREVQRGQRGKGTVLSMVQHTQVPAGSGTVAVPVAPSPVGLGGC